LTNPYLTLTPHPTKVIPLHKRGNKIPVLGSVAGESIVASAPRFLEFTEHDATVAMRVGGFSSFLLSATAELQRSAAAAAAAAGRMAAESD
jgi:hypothetical protein